MNRRLKQMSEGFSKPAEKFMRGLKTPYAVQEFLDSIEYSADPIYRTPARVVADRRAHCVDGAIFAAAALRRIGFSPVIIELKAVRDDDHLLALFRARGRIGAVAKSNFTTLRWREPVYKNLRELVMSYFEGYFNLEREKSLRSYSAPLDLSRFDRLNWMTDEKGIETVLERLESARHFQVADNKAIAALRLVDDRSYNSALLGAKLEGLYVPGSDKKKG